MPRQVVTVWAVVHYGDIAAVYDNEAAARDHVNAHRIYPPESVTECKVRRVYEPSLDRHLEPWERPEPVKQCRCVEDPETSDRPWRCSKPAGHEGDHDFAPSTA